MDATEELCPPLVIPGSSTAETNQVDNFRMSDAPEPNVVNCIFIHNSASRTAEEQSKAFNVAKAFDAKNLLTMCLPQKNHPSDLREKKQVGNFRMLDAPELKRGKRKGKGKAKETDEPNVPPPNVAQHWNLQRSHDIKKFIAMQPADSTSQNVLESATDIMDTTEEMGPPLVIPGSSRAESENVPPASTPPQKKNRKIEFTPSIQLKTTWSPAQKKHLANLREKKHVDNFRMPDAPEPKRRKGKVKRKGKAKETNEVPNVSPPNVAQQWELHGSHDIRKFATMQSASSTPQTVSESAIDIMNATEELGPPLVIPGSSTEESETVTPASTLPRKKNRKIHFTPSTQLDTTWSPAQKKHLANLMEKKHVDNFRMPDAPEPKRRKGKVKRKGKAKETNEVPNVSPPNVAQQSELHRSHDIRKIAAMQSAGSTLQTVSESAMDNMDATEELGPPVVISGSSIAESATAPPASALPRKKNCKIQFTPSKIQGTVFTENDFLGFTSSSTTSAMMPGSESSDNELDVNSDTEMDFIEPGEGSDVEHEGCIVDFTFKNVNEYQVDSDPSLAEALSCIDTEADLALRAVIGPGADQDLLNFEWHSEPENFKGIQEVFTVPSTGPTFENVNITPLEVFLKIWDSDIIALIVCETNRYGSEMLKNKEKPSSRIRRWKDVTDDEIRKFFAISMLQSFVVNNVEREYWYPKLNELQIGNFGAIMSYNRFLMIKQCLHFVDNASLPEHPNKLDKIRPIIKHLNKKFSSLYVLEQNVAIVSFFQKIETKKAKEYIKSYELCELRTGYLWRMEVSLGKEHVHVAQIEEREPVEGHEDEPESATSQIVLTLMRPLFNRGHTLVMDSFHNAPLLSRILKVKHKTDSMGTLRLSREFVPEELKNKSKSNMKAGEVAFSTTKDLNVVVWMNKNIVTMLSTFHPVTVGGKEKYGYYRYKPKLVLDYNLSMGGIDYKYKMLQAYPIERIRNHVWYKKLFRRLVNMSIHNAYVMFNHNRTQVIRNREFRLQVAKQLLEMCSTYQALPRPLPPALSQMHLPAKNERPQRCKACHAAKVRRRTMWRCSTCAVNLCIVGCYTAYHKELFDRSIIFKTKK